LHVTSHAHDAAQLVLPHAPEPSHVCVHRPVPHVTLPHAVAAEPDPDPDTVQSIVQLAELPHSMLPQAPAPVHAIVQFHPVGQVTSAPLPVIVQVSLAKSHESHVAGQTAASTGSASIAASSFTLGSTTQKPPSQTRPPLQSVCIVHASLSVLVLTVQLHTAITATTAIASALTSCLAARTSRHHRAPERA
jgi:hypothetical protein